MEKKRLFFTPEERRKLAKNPFVDKKMMQFIRSKSVDRDSMVPYSKAPGVPASPDAGTGSVLSRGSAGNRGNMQQPVISDRAAALIAAVIKGMLGGGT